MKEQAACSFLSVFRAGSLLPARDFAARFFFARRSAKEGIMVHVFENHGQYYIFDSGSSSLHACDEAAARLLAVREGVSSHLSAGGAPALSAEERADYEADFAELKGQGLLFAPETDARPAKSDKVKALCLHICHDCNLRCKYCFADEGAYHAARQFMSFETAKRAIDFLIEHSGERRVLETDFFGGEPLMNFDVVKQTVLYGKEEAAKRGKKFLFTLTTNGLLLKGEIADFLNEEFENVVLSLDGRPEVHDAVRKTANGRGSFDLCFENIREFVKKRGDKKYYVRGTFTAKNLDFSKDVLFLADCGFASISMEPVVTDIPELAIREEHLPRICEEYDVLCGEYLRRWRAGRGFGFFHFDIDLEGGPCLSKRVSACGAGNEYFSVLPNGDIYPCHQFAGDAAFRMGSVYGGELDAALRGRFCTSCLFTRKTCDTCFAKYICSGGCSANNYHFNGDIDVPYAITCAMMKKRVECAMHILAEKKKEQ